MKQGIHPKYDYVVFRDRAADFAFLARSTVGSAETVEWEDGKTYPVIDVQISSASHPFWTGKSRVLDDEGRVAKFYKKYGKTPAE